MCSAIFQANLVILHPSTSYRRYSIYWGMFDSHLSVQPFRDIVLETTSIEI
ncbi:hypothetical protein O9993_09595 [Vibrio lentus]|nr:hypothetical protein [Vibrio lentus]